MSNETKEHSLKALAKEIEDAIGEEKFKQFLWELWGDDTYDPSAPRAHIQEIFKAEKKASRCYWNVKGLLDERDD